MFVCIYLCICLFKKKITHLRGTEIIHFICESFTALQFIPELHNLDLQSGSSVVACFATKRRNLKLSAELFKPTIPYSLKVCIHKHLQEPPHLICQDLELSENFIFLFLCAIAASALFVVRRPYFLFC